MRLEPEYRCSDEKLRTAFQFHKGAIRTDDLNDDYAYYPNFNSIKVRLEHFILLDNRAIG